MRIGVGIDTGGTYTDAVIYDFESKKILSSAKSLTTKDDLSVGILGAIDGLPPDYLRKAEVISLSTTLATNACVEDKGGRAKLIFFGGDERIIDEHGERYGLPPSREMVLQESFTQLSGVMEREPDWERFMGQLESGFENVDGVGIVEMNAMRNSAFLEKKAKTLFQEKYDIPVVCGHELFSELNSLQRGASTLLNAGLFPVIKEFLRAIKKALLARDIRAALVVMRSDGSLMSEEFASTHPVETLLCGPAASTIGGTRLLKNHNSIVIDMGGTTTDVALVKNGTPVTVVGGVSIGKWKTFVDGLYIKTFGLGGDSAIHYGERGLALEDYRVVPLCVAARQYPSVLMGLRRLMAYKRKHTQFLYEHYMLVRDIGGSTRYTEDEKAFCRALKERPLILEEAAEAAGKDVYSLNVKRLIKDGVVQICGLTPTDIMHIKGDFNGFEAEASRLGAEFAAHNLGISVPDLCDRVYCEVKRKLYLNIVTMMLENNHSSYMKSGVGKDVEALINESYDTARAGERDSLISARFATAYSLVGIGAPIRIFLPDVAELLGTDVAIPEHYEVANALGAIIGNISAVNTVEIRPAIDAEGAAGFVVFGKRKSRAFREIDEAEAFAVADAQESAKAEAINRGAKGEITVHCTVKKKEAEIKDGVIYIGTIIKAHAIGALSF